MDNKGFTLIELLAVMVILAIIALIAVPIILNIINDARESSKERSIELYGVALENAVAKYQLANPTISINECEILSSTTIIGNQTFNPGDLSCNNGEIGIRVEIDNKDTIDLYFKEGRSVYYFKDGKLIRDMILCDYDTENSSYDRWKIGAKYKCKVNSSIDSFENAYNFYILSVNDKDGNIITADQYPNLTQKQINEIASFNLILDRYVCEDGSVVTNYSCSVRWHSGSYVVTYGPDTIYERLEKISKKWNYIPLMNFNYYKDNMGYNGIRTIVNSNKYETQILAGDNSSSYDNIRLRLPTSVEMNNINSGGTNRYSYLYENLGEYGYFTCTSNDGGTVYRTHTNGSIDMGNPDQATGLRPVITIPKYLMR